MSLFVASQTPMANARRCPLGIQFLRNGEDAIPDCRLEADGTAPVRIEMEILVLKCNGGTCCEAAETSARPLALTRQARGEKSQ